MKSGQLKRTTAAFTVATLVLLFGSQKPTRAQAAASGSCSSCRKARSRCQSSIR
jgi:hypothetical protein